MLHRRHVMLLVVRMVRMVRMEASGPRIIQHPVRICRHDAVTCAD